MNSRSFMGNGNVITHLVAAHYSTRIQHGFRTFHGVFDARFTTVRGLKTDERCCVCTPCASSLALTAGSLAVAGIAFERLEFEGSLSTTADSASLDACWERSVDKIIEKRGGNTRIVIEYSSRANAIDCTCKIAHLAPSRSSASEAPLPESESKEN